MITLPEPARLVWPTAAVRTSYLVGEQADCLLRGTDTEWLGPASDDFEDFVNVRRGVLERWGVPTTVFWYVSREYYLVHCRTLGLTRVLLCCEPDNEASRRVILHNGGQPDGRRHGEERFWITLT